MPQIFRVACGVGLAVAIFACSTSPSSPSQQDTPNERLGTVTSALFSDGLPCAGDTQCTSNHCVDGVCCDTACGGGVRDTLSCSNIYGVVAGLVNGKCTTIATGESCGALSTANPCTWRGAILKPGGNCPNSASASSACFPCTTSSQCSGAFSVCAFGACVQCDGDSGAGTPAACPSSKPICNTTGACTECSLLNDSACLGTTPTCDVATMTCAACNGDNGSSVATRACPTTTEPACLGTGACGQCSTTNATACSGATPSCDTTMSTCVACNGDNGSLTTQPCPTASDPFCFATGGAGTTTGSCGKCTTNTDCIGHPGGDSCNTITGACGAQCILDSDCGDSTKWCSAGTCITKTANAQPLPAAAPINGICTVANGARTCASGVCSAGDNKCGLSVGDPCAAETDCRSAICSLGKCGNCLTDASCGATTSGQVCNDLTKTCEAGCRGGASGNGCPIGQVCTSTNATIGQCVQCINDSACGNTTSGKVCNNTSKTCQDGCRGLGGNGCVAGHTCSSNDATIGTCGVVLVDAGVDASLSDASLSDAASVPDADASGGINVVDASVVSTDADTDGGVVFVQLGGPNDAIDPELEGSGCSCDVSKISRSDTGWTTAVGVVIALTLRRRSNANPRRRRKAV